MRPFVIKNVKIVLETKTINLGYLLIRDGVIAEVGEQPVPEALAALQTLDGEGMFLCPGFVDLHAHGGGDHDFMDGEADDILCAARAHLAHGTTTIAPTTLTSGHMLRWSIAPELDGAMALGDELKARGIIASIGHSNADYETVKESLKHGFTHVTHLYSGMSTITRRMGHRVLGVVECAYLFDELDVEIIADGIHLPPELLRLILKTKNNRQISLVTDSMRGAGMPEGPSVLGSRSHGMPVMISGGIANMLDHSGFAGSVATTDRLVRTMVQKAGLPLHEAVNMASLHPARLIHKDDEIGSIAVGKRADLVLLDENLLTRRVFVDGHEITSH